MSNNPKNPAELRNTVLSLFGYHREEQSLGPCLFISRESGAGGGEIAQHVAEELGWDLLDKEILDRLTEQYGTPRSVMDFVDEKEVSWLADVFNGWIEGHGFSQLAYVHRLHHLFMAVAQRGRVVVVGRGARFILPRQVGFSVRIVAPLAYRVKRTVSTLGLSADDARTFVEEADRQRSVFLERYFHQDVADAHLHDLIVNVERVGIDAAAKLILDAVRVWLAARISRPHDMRYAPLLTGSAR